MRQSSAAMVEQKRGYATTRVRRAAQRNRIKMHALEVARRLVFLGIADSAECVLGFERNPPQCVSGEGNSRIGEIAPVPVAAIM